MTKEKTIIGRAEKADFPELSLKGVPVKIDTGADACSIWATMTEKGRDGELRVVFFGQGSRFFTGREHVFAPKDYSMTRVANSFGHKELRYKVKLRILVKKRLIKATFTLSNRSSKLYPVLIGRTLLRNKFIVDVAKGTPLRAAEEARAEQLKSELERVKGFGV